jgi:hypothetical protein
MAGRENKAKKIVPDLLVDRTVQVQAFLSQLEVASDLFVLALECLAAPDQVDGAVLRGPHEPGARPLRHSIGRPLLERGDQGVLCKLLSRPDIADDTSQPADEPGRLDPPDRFDRTMRGCVAATRAGGRVSLS